MRAQDKVPLARRRLLHKLALMIVFDELIPFLVKLLQDAWHTGRALLKHAPVLRGLFAVFAHRGVALGGKLALALNLALRLAWPRVGGGGSPLLRGVGSLVPGRHPEARCLSRTG